MICKQACRNFITLIENGQRQPYCGKKDSAVRQLYLSGKTARAVEEDRLSSIRSLTISDHDGEELVDFEKCKMLRVLDVENCKKVEDTDLQKICKLLYLNYLNLRGTNVKTLPSKAAKLHYLQILDMRETSANIELPMEVLILGQLVHLFGRFKLPPELSKVGTGHTLVKLLERESKLKTFAGFVLDGCNGFQHIMSAITTLRKVKFWSRSTQGNKLVQCLVPSLQKRFTEDSALDSLSIDFGNDSIDFLDSLQGPCALESIKLHGKLTRLPDFFLKGGFLVPKLPKIEVMEGAMPVLESLQLFSQNIQGLDVSAVKCLHHLKEVTLRSSIDAQTMRFWEDEAKKHKNRPTIVVAQSQNT
ncbi:unnamed protein product [Triticum turgidum subsp. durum]|uniref:Disease resistance R13L4/SHOC-2-like LRR domain-containing protein n=1 Tax=Triticum turgidum subsp. durum TaxID=4567 RepID=A0A9R1BGH4_TRITD|nr:unnamed protein product [Triticum turgidum subsp. durum]